MLSEVTWPQMCEWIAFAELEPFDEVRADLRAASIVSALLNVNRDKKKHPKAITIPEVMLRLGDMPAHRPAQTWQQQKAIGKMWAMMMGAGRKAPPKPTPRGVRRRVTR